MKAENVLKMIEDGEIEELKKKLREEIYTKELDGGTDAKKRYAAMKRYFKFANKINPAFFKPGKVQYFGEEWNSFISAYSLVLTKESIGEIECFKESDGKYFDVLRIIEGMHNLSCEKVHINQLIAEAKSRGYKYKKSEVSDSGDFEYAVKYKDAYFKVGILDQAYSIIDDGEVAEVYYGGERGITFIATSIGIAGVLSFLPQKVNMKNKEVIVYE